MATLSAWNVFFMFMVIPPISKAMSSVFMSLVTRAGTVDEERLAFGGMASLAAIGGAIYGTARGGSKRINQTASNIAKSVTGNQGGGDSGGSTAGSQGADGAASSVISATSGAAGGYTGAVSGRYTSTADSGYTGAAASDGYADGADGGADGASPGSPYGYYEGGYRMVPIPPIKQREATSGSTGSARSAGSAGSGAGSAGTWAKKKKTPPPPLEGINERAGEQSTTFAKGAAFAGALAPVAGPAVAAMLGATGKMAAGPTLAVGHIAKNLYTNTRQAMRQGEGLTSAMGNSVKNLTGAGSVSEANARIIGSILGSSLGTSTSQWAGNTAGKVMHKANDLVDKFRN